MPQLHLSCLAWIPLKDNNVGISSLSTYVHYFFSPNDADLVDHKY